LDFPYTEDNCVDKFYDAFAYLDAHGVGDNLMKLQKAKRHIMVLPQLSLAPDSYTDNPEGVSVILWSPENELVTDNGITLSPAVLLDHEADHGVEAIYHPKEFYLLSNKKDKNYTDLEEKRVITGREQKTARALGEIKEGQVTREKSQRTRGSGYWPNFYTINRREEDN